MLFRVHPCWLKECIAKYQNQGRSVETLARNIICGCRNSTQRRATGREFCVGPLGVQRPGPTGKAVSSIHGEGETERSRETWIDLRVRARRLRPLVRVQARELGYPATLLSVCLRRSILPVWGVCSLVLVALGILAFGIFWLLGFRALASWLEFRTLASWSSVLF